MTFVLLATLVACDSEEPRSQDPVAERSSPIATAPSPATPRPDRDRPPSNAKHEIRGPSKLVELWYGLEGDLLPGENLVAVRREIPVTPAIAAATLRAWLKGPTRQERAAGIFGLVPEGSRLLGVAIAEGTATIDLSSDFERTNLGTTGEGMLLEQLAWTITQFPTVERALLTIDGETKEYYLGHGFIIDETHPLARN